MTEHNKAYLSEVFSAIQGEGPFIGARQIFIRFSICDIRCSWCDTPESLTKNDFCLTEKNNGSREFEKIKNPLTVKELLSHIESLSPKSHHSISLTGGEPLLQNEFLKLFLPEIKDLIPVYLETGGHRPDKLKTIVNFIDYISMDFKLPSSASTGVFWDKHKEFLEIASSTENLKKLWIKIVVTEETSFDELIHSTEIIKSVYPDNSPEIFLQPVTQINNISPPKELKLLKIQEKLLNVYRNIRVVPQVHKLIGQK